MKVSFGDDCCTTPESTVHAFIRRIGSGLKAAFSICILISLPLLPVTVLAQQPLPASAISKNVTHSKDAIAQALSDRGLLGNDPTATAARVEPPAGTEVDETVQTAKQDGKVISRTRAWSEALNSRNTLHIELTSYPSRQLQVAFWVLPNDSRGCAIFGRTMYDANGNPLKSEFWRNADALKITGAADFPSDLYPEAVPAIALLRVVDPIHQGASGKINQQVSPYGFVDLKINVEDSPPLQVPAGRFAAIKLDSQPNVSTILPSWPRFTLGMVSRFLPQTTYYFEAAPPHRLLRLEQAGTPFVGGPEATTELIRYYIAGKPENASTSRGHLASLRTGKPEMEPGDS